MNVLHVSQPTVDGVAHVVLSHVRDQVNRGWSVTVACPSSGFLADGANGVGAAVAPWSSNRSPGPSVFREARALQSIVERVKPDIVHLHPPGWPSRPSHYPWSPTDRASTPLVVISRHLGANEARHGLVGEVAVRWTNAIVVVSNDEAAEGRREGISSKYYINPNGVDVNCRYEGSRRDARLELGLADATPLAVCVGRLCEQKGQDRLLSAWPKVLKSIPTAELYLVGVGETLETLRSQASRLSNCHVLGESHQVSTWLAASTVVVLPSRWEAGLSLVAMEGMANARSIISSEVAGAKQGLLPDCGAVVPQGDEEQLVTALIDRLRDQQKADNEGRNGQRRVDRSYTVLASTERTAMLYGRFVQ